MCDVIKTKHTTSNQIMKKTLLNTALIAATISANAGIVVLDESFDGISKSGSLYKTTDNINLVSTNEYILPGQLFVTNNNTFSIPQGTVIRGIPGAASPFATGSGYVGGSLIVSRDGQINAEGVKGAPIIFTTAALKASGSTLPDATINYSDPATVFSGKSVSDFWDTASTTAATGTSSAMPPLSYTTSVTNDSSGDISASATDDTTEQYQKMWGGLVVLGSAPTSIGRISGSVIAPNNVYTVTKNEKTKTVALATVTNDPFEGQIEGLVVPEVGELSCYGGPNPNDSSGTLRFVSIRHGGEDIGTGNEINGLTMGGVGYGTKVEYVEVYSNNDDGVEFFGGTVNTRYMAVVACADDSFDMDEGFTGLGQFWFVFQSDDQINGDQCGEHDGTKANYSSIAWSNIDSSSEGGVTLSFPTIYNATYIGGGNYGNRAQDSGTNCLFTIRDGFGGAYYNSIFSDARDGAVAVASDGHKRWDLGHVIFKNNYWYGNAAAFTTAASFQGTRGPNTTNNDAYDIYNNGSGAAAPSAFSDNVATVDPWAAANRISGAADSSYDGQIKRRNWVATGTYRANHGGFDPAEVSTAVANDATIYPVSSTFFIPAAFHGAFNIEADSNSQDLWTEGWTAFDALYYTDR